MNTRSLTSVGLIAICMVTLWQAPSAHAQIIAPREAAQIEFGPTSIYPSVRIVDAGHGPERLQRHGQPER